MANITISTEREDWLETAIKGKYIKLFDYKQFKICEPLGEGGFGKVWRAEWKANSSLTLNFAVKSIKNLQNSTTDNKIYREMVKELQLLHDMTMSPNVLHFYGITK
ncbi:7973_t:CDS:2, partial [Ambispora leptoticha]